MATGRTIDSVLADARQILRVWNDNPTFSLGNVTKEQFASKINELESAQGETQDLRTRLTEKVNTANDKMEEVNALNVRARGGFKAIFGQDSSQYAQAGG